MSFLGKLWDIREETTMKVLSACMVIVAVTVSVAFIRQVVFLDRELVCDGTWFPSERCTMTDPEHSHPVPEHPHPHTHPTAPEHSHPVQLAEHSHNVPARRLLAHWRHRCVLWYGQPDTGRVDGL